MLQMSKILRSRDEWKRKTIQCHYELREFRKNQKRHQQKIAALKLENSTLNRAIADKKNGLSV